MAGLKGQARWPGNEARLRRNSARLASEATFIGQDQVISLSSGVLVLDLATDPGLENSSGALRVKIKAASGIVRDADGLSVDVTVLAAATEADKGVVNQSAARVDSGEDTVTLTSVTTSITDPADTPATADALRDDLVTNALSEIGTALGALATRDTENETAIETLATEFNDLLAKLHTAGILNT